MAVWAIGDIQGCFNSLKKILNKIDFDPKKDKLWVAGDLVNRGEGSLETLEYIYSIKDSVEVVLGNHDITLIGAYYGLKKSNPTLDPILHSPRVDELMSWLKSQKFLHVDDELGFCMSHAGISPMFTLEDAKKYANRIESKLNSSSSKDWLEEMFNGKVTKLEDNLTSIDLDRYIINSFTRMRFCYADGTFDFNEKYAPTKELYDLGLMPWFEVEKRKSIKHKIVFGHWSTLGNYEGDNVICLDTGCLWGRSLTVARLDGENIQKVSLDC